MPTLQLGARDAVSYDDTGGPGPLVVLVHGSPGISRVWQPVTERLAPRFRVVAPNLPGYGGTTPPPAEAPGDSSYAAGLIEALVATAGEPAVLAGHSYGGVVALQTTLRGRIAPRALALFEPVAVPVLDAIGDAEAFASTQALFEDYRGAFAGGDREAARRMVEFWFGAGVFEQMPSSAREFLIAHTPHNLRDIGATFRDRYSLDALGRLTMPVLVAVGSRSPDVTSHIARALVAHVARGEMRTVEKANHALTTTHPDAVAALISELAGRV
ncbi:MAG TPA: alpha/beta hydrolase [Candidatus Bathyarchaeia archaeon]|nr:alpha/beta hydrolase [Candidatus Bathyarchaeia archaeon]